MNIKLTSEQESFIAEKVRTSGYSSAEGVVAEGLRLIRAKEEYEQHLERLRKELDIGIQQADRGELLDGREVFSRILERNKQRPRRQ